MTDGLKPYSEYRASGLPWCPEIPAHWAIRRNGGLFSPRVDTGHAHLPILEVSLRTGVRVRDMASGSRKQVLAQKENYKRAAHGDIAYNMMRMWQGAVGVAPVDGLISPAYVVARPLEGTLSNYYSHLFRMDSYMQEVNKYSRGIVSDRNRLYWNDFKQMPSLRPSFQEQKLIVAYVNSLRGKVGAVVRSKQRLIGLLLEEKRAIAHRAVTGGFSEATRGIESSDSFFDRIPSNWNATTLRRCLTRIDQGWSPSAAEGDIGPDQWAVLSLSSVRGGKFNGLAAKPIPRHLHVPPQLELRGGELLMTRSNTRNLVGDACIVTNCRPRTIYSDLIYKLSVNEDRAIPEWILLLLLSSSGRQQIEVSARGSSGTMPKLSQQHIKNLRVSLPPISEQIYLVASVAEHSKPLIRAINRAEREVALLREYQTRLIADVVTGKFDVRVAAAALPDLASYDLDFSFGEADEDPEGDDTTEESM